MHRVRSVPGLEAVLAEAGCPQSGVKEYGVAAGVSVGPWMSLAPELGSAEIPADSLSKGRIIARAFFRSGADSVLAYWYVDSTAAGWRSIWITSHPAHPFIVGTLLVHPHTGAGAGRAAKSRVIVDPMSAQTSGCNTCSTTPGWCRDTLLSVSMAPLFGDLAPWVWAGAAPSR